MKSIFKPSITIFFLSILCLSLIEGGQSEVVDKGFGILQIGEKFSKLKSYLIKTDTSKLINEIDNVLDEPYGWTLNLKKAHLDNYFGLKIKSIEIYFEGDEDDDGNTINKRVNSFSIFTETPVSDSLKKDFCKKLITDYGLPQINGDTSNSNTEPVIYYQWYGHTTNVAVIFGTDILNKNKLDYYEANFYSRKGD